MHHLTHKRLTAGLRASASTAALLSALAIAAPAFAQDAGTAPAAPAAAAEAPATGQQDIVVTAQFRNQRLQDVPLAITAVDSMMLDARSQNNITQVAKQAPSVVVVPAGGAFGPSIGASIRGVGQFDFNPAYEPGVGLYIDDVYYATLTGGVFDLLDLDRVEILRGPQGTLAGRNSEGGAIKLYSKRPDANEGGYVEAGYGARNAINLRGSADFKITDTLFGRVAGVFKRQDGFVDLVDYGCARPGNPENIAATRAAGTCTVDKLGETDYKGLRGQLRWNPSDAVDITLSGDYTYQNQTNAPEVTTYSTNPNYLCGRYCTFADFSTKGYNFQHTNQFKGGGGSLNAVFKLADDLSLNSITAYRAYTATFGTDDDFSPGVESTPGDPNTRKEAGGFNRLRHHFFSQEVRLNGAFLDRAVEWTIGGYYSSQKTTYFTLQNIGYIVPGAYLTFMGNDPVNANSKAAFATAIVHPGIEGLTLTGGIRYTKEHKDYTFVRVNPDGSPLSGLAAAFGLGALNGLTAKFDGDRVDYRASVDYRFSPAVLLYGTISTGFKGGGTSARPFTAQQALQGTFKPETLTNYEIGIKTDLFDRRLRLNLSAYIDEYKDIQLPLRDCTAYGGGPCGVVANAGNARNKGVELEISATPTPGLSIDGSMSYIHSRLTTVSAALGSDYRIGDPATFSPAWQASAGIQYKAQLGGNAGSITPRVDYTYNDRQFTGRALGFAYYLPAYSLVNARLTWRNSKEDLELSASVTNLFDKYYYNSMFASVYSFSGTAYQQIGRPREWMLTVKKTF
ncbi:TonB-dependent receptor [Sphingomonas lycopersici]|uniref:TonB-dependent receptor n=1 Tax=Sphingomonas lycopersici TaxID=2951807 RepID=A0AA41ZD54_9SPHN|nr:TonB-dependent receptor [Sphingomonas lycopersici]MCW6533533.1 TonB-dependent receptor [Sphingomonas lycopersici]